MDSIFKKTLRSELDFQDVKVKELAFKTGLSKRTLEGYLGARASIPPADVAVKIAGALNVSVEYLVTGSESAKKQTNDEINSILHDIRHLSSSDLTIAKTIVHRLSLPNVQK